MWRAQSSWVWNEERGPGSEQGAVEMKKKRGDSERHDRRRTTEIW